MSEQIEDSKTGLFFSPTDSRDLKKKINMLFDNPELRKKISEKARQKVLEKNSPEFVAKQLEEALSSIIRES
jgi:glycosyltransferase involved in cell wall biosynthesis